MENEVGFVLNKDTSDFIKEIKKATNVTGCIPLVMNKVSRLVKNLHSAPELTYTKEVVNVCQSKQISPYLRGQVLCLQCGQAIRKKGWMPRCRRVETLDGHKVLIQEQFQCDCGKFSSLSFLFNENERFSGATDAIRSLYPVWVTRKCCVDNQLLNIIVNDVISSKSVDQIGDAVGNARVQRLVIYMFNLGDKCVL